jgi:hypothetical protein
LGIWVKIFLFFFFSFVSFVFFIRASVIKGMFFLTQIFENAAVIDMCAPADRGAALALNGAMLGIGLISGSVISVVLGSWLNHAFPFLLASLFSFAMLLGKKKKNFPFF